tara:strand:- start:6741 stop:7052 length:312 start_codon:yes stop_codon:yes gene_type:complete
LVSGTLKGFEVGFLEIVDAGEPVFLNEGLMSGMVAVEIVLFLRVEPHADAERMRIFGAGLATDDEVFDILNFRQGRGGGEERGFFVRTVRMFEAKGDGVFNHG